MKSIKAHCSAFLMQGTKLTIRFEADREVQIRRVYLKRRNTAGQLRYRFGLRREEKKDLVRYSAQLDVKDMYLEEGKYDLTLLAEINGRLCEAYMEMDSVSWKIRFILLPRWIKTARDQVLYPFQNTEKQFVIQVRPYDPRYDQNRFMVKEAAALAASVLGKGYMKRRNIWIICEKFGNMAQENGYYFFKYCMDHLPEEEKKRIYFLIDPDSADYEKVRPYEKQILPFGSFKHLFCLHSANLLVGSEAISHFYPWNSPNTISKALFRRGKNLVFLQHGVMGLKQCHAVYSKNSQNRVARFITSSFREQDIIHEFFGYDRKEILVTGLPRWDVLKDTSGEKAEKEILLMPTWRKWLEDVSEEVFRESDYYKAYKRLLESPELKLLLEEKKVVLNFYIHRKFHEYFGLFGAENERIRFIAAEDQPLNELLMSCSMMITDYSSACWDVYWQEKPVLFYHFDREMYERLIGSYMDLSNEVFGDTAANQEELLEDLRLMIENGFQEKERYAEMRRELLTYRDHDNCRRIYESIGGLRFESKLKLKVKDLLKRK